MSIADSSYATKHTAYAHEGRTVGIMQDYEYVVDSDPNKHGKYLPLLRRPVFSPEQLRLKPVDCVLVTSYTYFDEILAQLDWFRASGGNVIRVYPTPEVA